jgi:hypothetical protein
MRTTLTLDPDVAIRVKAEAADHNIAFKTLVNEALRLGLDAYASRAKAAKPYRTHAVPMGLKAELSYDNVSELLAQCEGEAYR